MTRKIKFAEDEKYHVYNRGIEKIPTFRDVKDYFRFLKLMYVCNSNKKFHIENMNAYFFNKKKIVSKKNGLVYIIFFTLMPNHYHMIIEEKKSGNLSIFMQKFMTAYTMYFNKKYERTGNLFSSPFKATHINNSLYYEYLKKYLYHNPLSLIKSSYDSTSLLDPDFKLSKKEEKFLRDYPYTSFSDEASPFEAWPEF